MTSGIALVTGANRGIGLELVRQLAQRGFTAVLASRDPEKGRAAAERLHGLDVDPRRMDVADPTASVSWRAGSRTTMGDWTCS
jgi:NAD(P)-dependent dehydrogenase (short-subunit alcohol dehydrogenase family)